MPLIKGYCLPPVCVRLRFNLAAAAVVVFDRQTGVVDPKKSATAAQFFAQTLADWIQKLVPIEVKCDGCACHMPEAAPPALPMPDVPLGRVGNWVTVIRGGTCTFELGYCHPPKWEGQEGWREVSGMSRAALAPKSGPGPRGKSGRAVAQPRKSTKPRASARRKRRS